MLSQCLLCKHAVRGPEAVCSAFPGQIPPEILANEFDHRKPWIDQQTGQPGDRGIPLERSITFEVRDGVNPLTLTRLYRYLDDLQS